MAAAAAEAAPAPLESAEGQAAAQEGEAQDEADLDPDVAGEEEPPAPRKPLIPPLEERLAKIEEEGLEAGKRHLELSDEPVGNEGADRLVKGLANNTGLRRLLLQRAGLTKQGFEAIGRLLYDGGRVAKRREKARARIATGEQASEEELLGGAADELQRLVLSGNDCGPEGLRSGVFVEGLSETMNLRTLSMACCSLGDTGVAFLCEAVGLRVTGDHHGCTLRELDLSHNNMGPAGLQALAKALGTNPLLETVDIKANEFGPEGAEGVKECLRANKGRMQRFIVSQCNLQLDGVRAVVEQFRLPVQFVVNVNRPRGQSVGFNLDAKMAVMGVHPNGVIDRWNNTNPSEAISMRDQVVRVNTFTEQTEMLEELSVTQALEIEVFRPGAGTPYLDLCHNSVPLAGLEEIRADLGRPEAGSLVAGLVNVGGGRQVNLNAF